MKFLSLLIMISLTFTQTSPLSIDASRSVEFLVQQNSKLSEHFYVNYTIGQRATQSIKMNFYILPSVRMNMIGAQNATIYNLNWAQEIHDQQKNQYFRGINPVGLIYVMATWSGLIDDPTTESALQKSMRKFIGE